MEMKEIISEVFRCLRTFDERLEYDGFSKKHDYRGLVEALYQLNCSLDKVRMERAEQATNLFK